MENWLTNSCEYDEARLTEAFKAQFQETQRKKNLFFAIAAAGMLIFSLCGLLITGEKRYQVALLLSVPLVVLLGYTILALPGKAAKTQAARIRQASGSLQFRFLFREEDVVLVTSDGKENTPLRYGNITRLIQTEKLIVVFAGEKQALVLDRSRFENGTEADFWKLMGEKCPAALPKKRRDS
jgi:hypothetical protein